MENDFSDVEINFVVCRRQDEWRVMMHIYRIINDRGWIDFYIKDFGHTRKEAYLKVVKRMRTVISGIQMVPEEAKSYKVIKIMRNFSIYFLKTDDVMTPYEPPERYGRGLIGDTYSNRYLGPILPPEETPLDDEFDEYHHEQNSD